VIAAYAKPKEVETSKNGSRIRKQSHPVIIIFNITSTFVCVQ